MEPLPRSAPPPGGRRRRARLLAATAFAVLAVAAALALAAASPPADPSRRPGRVAPGAAPGPPADPSRRPGRIASGAAPAPSSAARPLVERLRRGGQVVYFRHAATAASGVDPLATIGDCSAQRRLSARGRADARAIGRAFRELRIPVGPVRSSPFCRTLDTARLAFGRATPDRRLIGLLNAPGPEERRSLVAALRRLLAMPVPAGTNRVLSGHDSNIAAAAGVDLGEGDALVGRPRGGSFRVLAVVTPAEWRRWARPR